MPGVLPLALLFVPPGFLVLAAARARGAVPWPWPVGTAVAVAFGLALAAVVSVGLGAAGCYSLRACGAVVAAVSIASLAVARFRPRWPLARAPLLESSGFVLVVTLATGLFLGRPFEMLLGERDAAVYTVSGIGLARGGSLWLRDHTADRIGPEAMRRFYPLPQRYDPASSSIPQYVKYPGFYFVDADRRWIVPQGLPMLPALIALFYDALGLDGAFVVNGVVGVVAVGCVFATGSALVGPLAATLGTALLTLDLVEVWASRYSVAEILFQMLLFAGLAAYLRGGRMGRALAGLLLGATLFAKVEAALIVPPIALFGIVAAVRRRGDPGAAFWAPFVTLALAAVACWFTFQADYVAKAYFAFSSLQSRIVHTYFIWPGAWMMLALLVLTLAAMAVLVLRSVGARADLSARVGRGLAVGVTLFALFGIFVRPHVLGMVLGQSHTFVWLSWYLSWFVLSVGFGGLACFLWTQADRRSLFVLGILLVLSLVFLHFTFVNLIHIYMTRRFVPAILPMLVLFFAYAVVGLGRAGSGPSRIVAVALSVALAAFAVRTIVRRSVHIYDHREYPNLARSFTELARHLEGKDLVFLSDGKVRNLLGPALEFVFGLDTLVVWPPAYEREEATIHRWLDDGVAIAALSSEQTIDALPGAEDFEPIDHPVWWIHVLDQAEDRFPTTIAEDSLVLNTYAAGKGSDPSYELWKRSGAEIARSLCDAGVQVVGGDGFLLRHAHAACPSSGVRGRTVGYLVADGDAQVWQDALEAYGARFVRRPLEGLVLFDEIRPRDAAPALASDRFTLGASGGVESARLVLDGRLDTRWGSQAPQHPGMSFTIGFAEPTSVSWLRVRSGPFGTDRARQVALETTRDGTHWQRRAIPAVIESLRWNGALPEENANGDRDLWIGEDGLRGVRLVNLSESSHFDWSIAEIAVEGKPVP